MRKSVKQAIYLASYILIVGFYIWVRLDSLSTVEKPRVRPDTERYKAVATQTLISNGFWTGETPPVIPAIYKVIGDNKFEVAWFQTAFSIFAWIALAFSVSRVIKVNWFRLAVSVLILAFSLSRVILLWDWLLLSESISGSLMALFIASWVWFLESPTWRWGRATLVALTGLFWMFTRDTNGLVILMVSLLSLLTVVFTKVDRRYLLLSAFFITFYTVSGWGAAAAGRWIGPNLNVVATRILPDRDSLAFYRANGMPVNDELMSFSGGSAGPVATGFSDSPDLIAFHEWHRKYGKSVYLKYLLSKPLETFLAPFQNFHVLLDSRKLNYYGPPDFPVLMHSSLANILFFKKWSTSVAFLSLVVFAAGLASATWKPDRRWLVLIVMGVLIYPHAFIIWHASGGDVVRHAYQFQVHYRLTFWLFLLFTMDALMTELSPGVQWVLHVYFLPFLYRARFVIVGVGSLGVLMSLLMDLVIPGENKFSIGHVQGAGVVLGLAMIAAGIWLHANPRIRWGINTNPLE